VERDGLVVDHPRYYYTPKVLQRFHGRQFLESVRQTFRRRVAEFRPDLVFAPWAYPDGWAAVRLARRAGLPVVLQVHGSDVRLAVRRKRRQLTFDALRAADGVVAVSQDLGRRLVEGGVDPDRVRVIYNGIDPAWFYPGPKLDARLRVGLPTDTDPVVLFIGNLVRVKGVEVLIDACDQLVRSGSRFHCRIIVEGPLAGALQGRVDQLGLGDRVKLLGSKPQLELPDWYRAADVLVLPSYSEGVPNVLLEAAACGTPCVASRVGGVPEITHRCDLQMTPPGDSPALAEAIRDVLSRRRQPRKPLPPARTRGEAVDELEQFLAAVLARAGASQPAVA
jgi:glycosyltransferase involved in cell wall biosynthesis